jgi:hypothetical protein
MAEIFDKIDFMIGQRLIGEMQYPEYADSRLFYDGEHFNGGKFWIGPTPSPDDPIYGDVMAIVAKNFVSRNIIKEVVDRHVSNVLANEPYWKFSPKRELGFGESPNVDEEKRMVEAEALLQIWVDNRIVAYENEDQNDVFRDALVDLLLGGRAVLRLFVPPDELVNGQVPKGSMEESLNRIYIHHTPSEDSCLYLDPTSQRQIGLFRYDYSDMFAQFHRGIEFSYLNRQKQTVIRSIAIAGSEADEGDFAQPVTIDLGGRLTMFEMRRPPMIGKEIHSLQKLHNMNWTMWGRNTVLAGFLERVVLNAHLPKGLKVGAGSTYSLIGKEIVDQDGRRTIATPNVLWRDPVDVTSFRTTREASYHAILEQVNMAHYTLSGDSRLSAESRRQSLSDYSKDLRITANAGERAMRWLLETVLKMAATFAGDPTRFDDLRAQVTISANPAIADPEMWLAVDQLVTSRMISREKGMSEVGVSDIDAELNRIASERASNLWETLGVPEETPTDPGAGGGEGGSKPVVVKSFVRRPRGQRLGN